MQVCFELQRQHDPCQDYCKYEGVTTWNIDANCKGCGASMAEAKGKVISWNLQKPHCMSG